MANTEATKSLSLAEQVLQEVGEYGTDSSSAKRNKALNTAKRLVQELEDDDAAMLRRIEQVCSAQVLKFVMSIGVLEHIPQHGSVSAEKLAQAVGSDTELIVRMMRLLVATGREKDFEETDTNTYAHRHTAGLLDKGRYLFHARLMDEMMIPIVGRLPEYFESHPLTTPHRPTHNPMTWAFDMEGAMWFQAVARNPEKAKEFALAMSGSWNSTPAQGYYPFSEELAGLSAASATGTRTFMVDVGGGHGADMKEIRQSNPLIAQGQIIVQDLPHALASLPDGFLPPSLNITTQEHDFFTPNPVKGAGVYYLRRVLHDWADDACEKILGHVRDAMATDSRVLVCDTILPSRVQGPDAFSYWNDVIMFAIGGKERTEEDWTALFERSGLAVVRFWKSHMKNMGIVEGRKK